MNCKWNYKAREGISAMVNKPNGGILRSSQCGHGNVADRCLWDSISGWVKQWVFTVDFRSIVPKGGHGYESWSEAKNKKIKNEV